MIINGYKNTKLLNFEEFWNFDSWGIISAGGVFKKHTILIIECS